MRLSEALPTTAIDTESEIIKAEALHIYVNFEDSCFLLHASYMALF